jgi:hypothetical protein
MHHERVSSMKVCGAQYGAGLPSLSTNPCTGTDTTRAVAHSAQHNATRPNTMLNGPIEPETRGERSTYIMN